MTTAAVLAETLGPDLAPPSQQTLVPALAVFRAPAACRESGATYRQISYWVALGVITPSIAEASGSGMQHVFSHEDVLVLKLIVRLRRLGAPLDRIDSTVLRAAVRSGVRRLIVNPRGDWAPADQPHVVMEAFRRLGPAVWVVDVG